MAEQVGRVLGGRYRLRALVGTGASAQVYLADDITLKRAVAVKMLHPSLADDPGFLKRFRAEAQAAAALNHPNIMAVYDWGEEEIAGTLGSNQAYLVCEYLSGGSLRAMLDRGRLLTPSQALIVGLETARALDYAHRRGFVHRDIKPANLLFGEDRRLRIADFGLARALAEAAWTEPAGVVMGTARYASPEQARGLAVDGRTDVYSLALVLTEAVTGKVPFASDTVTATLMNRLDKLMPVSADLGPLAPVVERAGRPDPEERFESGELSKALVLTAERLPRPQPLPLVPTLPDAPGEPTMLGMPAAPAEPEAQAGATAAAALPTGPHGGVTIVAEPVVAVVTAPGSPSTMAVAAASTTCRLLVPPGCPPSGGGHAAGCRRSPRSRTGDAGGRGSWRSWRCSLRPVPVPRTGSAWIASRAIRCRRSSAWTSRWPRTW
jgi:tRNA A-37 threonylcarbamoyl transferase component Bud32